MKAFLRENWLYIAAPLVIVLIGVVVMLVFSNGADPRAQYDVY